MATLTAPSPAAIAFAKTLRAVPSVREVWWSADRHGEDLWIYIASWDDADFEPLMRGEDEAADALGPDWDGVLALHVASVADRNIAGGPVRIEPKRARPL